MYEYSNEQLDACDDRSLFFEEEEMPESIAHAQLVRYLVALLAWILVDALCPICEHFAVLSPLEHSDAQVAPDIAVSTGVSVRPLSSWRIGMTGPAPAVVFEILSKETGKKDLAEKPTLYAHV